MRDLRKRILLIFAFVVPLSLGGPAAASEVDHVLKLYAKEFTLTPANTNIFVGLVRILVINEGTTSHGLVIKGLKGTSLQVKPGDTAQIIVYLRKGRYTFYCPKAGHRERGMEGRLRVLSHPRR